uniref:Uncharacterized protein n=1 Tax=Gasterosteus aculeatus TaxID=69293 RepID=G3PTK6_GASAC
KRTKTLLELLITSHQGDTSHLVQWRTLRGVLLQCGGPCRKCHGSSPPPPFNLNCCLSCTVTVVGPVFSNLKHFLVTPHPVLVFDLLSPPCFCTAHHLSLMQVPPFQLISLCLRQVSHFRPALPVA